MPQTPLEIYARSLPEDADAAEHQRCQDLGLTVKGLGFRAWGVVGSLLVRERDPVGREHMLKKKGWSSPQPSKQQSGPPPSV